ncbi:MAG TPA: hypothetical protein VKF81_01320 [Blastocatellia bacterium]|nr:hypothetical protein [Blastocatellia bacterium]
MTHEEMETAITRLFEGQELLTGKVIELSEEVAELSSSVKAVREEAEADGKLQREAINQMREQAEADRAEMREASTRCSKSPNQWSLTCCC